MLISQWSLLPEAMQQKLSDIVQILLAQLGELNMQE